MKCTRVRSFANHYVLPIFAVLALASCCGGKLPDVISTVANAAPVAVLVATPVMAATQLNDASGELPLEVSFDASGSFDTDGTIVSFDWDFDSDGTYDLLNGGPTATHTYPDAGQFAATVRVTDNGGLSDTDTATIQVLGPDMAPPEASGTGQVDLENPLSVTYDASTSFDLDGEIVQYDWDMDGDGVFEIMDGGPNPSYQFPDYGTYTVTVRVTDDDGFTDTGDIVVTLSPDDNLAPSAVLSATPDSGFAPGLEVAFDASLSTDTDGTIVSFDWDMDNDGTFEISDGGSTQGVTYDVDGVFTVNVLVTDDDGATDTATAQVTVGAIIAPTAVLVATPDSGIAPGLDVVFDASGSSDPDGTIVQYDWDMDNNGSFELFDGGIQRAVTFDVDGFYSVRVRVKDNHGATDIAEASVTVGAIVPPTASLTASPEDGNAPLDVIFDASGSFDPDGTIVSYDWDMDDDGIFEVINSASAKAVTYQNGGLYTVVVRVTDNDGASDTASTTVDVNELPVAFIGISSPPGTAPTTVNYDSSLSTDSDGTIVQYDWDMDNDGTFEIIDGQSTQSGDYQVGGIYSVVVQVTDDDGATDSISKTVDINNPPTAMLVANPADGTAPLDVTFDATGSTDPDGSIIQYDWDMDFDGDFEIIDGPATQEVNYFTGAWYRATVRVTDDDGATATATAGVLVNNAPNAVVEATPTSGSAPLDVSYDASGSNDSDGIIVSYDWDMDNDGTFEIIDSTVTQAANYPVDGLYTVSVRVTDNDGGTDIESATITVTTPPTAVLTGEFDGEWQIFWDATGSFDGGSGTIVQYDWDTNNDGTFDTIDYGPTYTQQEVGYYEEHTYGVRVTDNDGLTDTDYFTVNTDYGQD